MQIPHLEADPLIADPHPLWGQTPLEADPTPVMYAGKSTPPPWTEGMTDTCENTTLPQTSFAGGNKMHISLRHQSHRICVLSISEISARDSPIKKRRLFQNI